jgi:hypothetical protein
MANSPVMIKAAKLAEEQLQLAKTLLGSSDVSTADPQDMTQVIALARLIAMNCQMLKRGNAG